jgi:hypothetical protein
MKPIKSQFLKSTSTTICALALCGVCASAQTLIHRYSFNDAAGSSSFADSVGTANGTLEQGISANPNSAYLTGSQLQLDGTGGYGLLPGGLLSSQTQVTIEFWASYTSNAVWTRTFAFGDQTGGGTEDSGWDYTHYAGGNYENLNYQASSTAQSTYANNPGGLDGETNVHVVAVLDPVNNQMRYYNGTTLASTGGGGNPTLFPLSQLIDTYGLIGRSLYDVDPSLAGSIKEFRIYSGVLSVSNLVLDAAAGPGSIVNTPGGPLSAIHLISPINPLLAGQTSQQLLQGDFPNVTGVDLLAYGTNGGSTASFSSGNPAVLTVNASSGLITGVSAGTTTVTAQYGSFSATNSITVTVIPAALNHRYSFTSDASDSIGGANGTLNGNATVSGGQLVLDGSAGTYLSLPGNLIDINTNSAITIEAWTTIGAANGTWARLFEFGDGVGGADFFSVPQVTSSANNDHWSICESFGNGSQNLGGLSPTWDGTTAHHTLVMDPNTSRLESYINGVLEYSVQNANPVIANISTNVAWIGHSPFSGDPYLTGSVDEFRIYSGALTPQEIAVSDLSGPNSTNREPGALLSISVPARTVPAFSGLIAPTILANYANLANFSLIPNISAAPVVGLTLSSSNPNILTFVGNNMYQTFRPGVVTVTATYYGKTASGTITVENKGQLAHRYSFTADASDSVGNANGTNNGDANETGGQLVLDGTSGTYVSLPPNLLNGYNAVTIDTWTTLNTGSDWGRLFFFGDYEANEFYVCPDSTGTAHRISSGVYYGATFDDPPPLQNQTVHLTTVYGDGDLELYSNGVPVRVANNVYGPLSQVGQSLAWIGQSPYPGDPYVNCSVDEFRIYKGRLAPEEILASDILGPDQLLVTNVAMKINQLAQTSTLTWPVAAAGFSLQTSSNLPLGPWVTLTNAPTLIGNTNWQIALPVSGTQKYYRLWR